MSLAKGARNRHHQNLTTLLTEQLTSELPHLIFTRGMNQSNSSSVTQTNSNTIHVTTSPHSKCYCPIVTSARFAVAAARSAFV